MAAGAAKRVVFRRETCLIKRRFLLVRAVGLF